MIWDVTLLNSMSAKIGKGSMLGPKDIASDRLEPEIPKQSERTKIESGVRPIAEMCVIRQAQIQSTTVSDHAPVKPVILKCNIRNHSMHY